MVGSTVNPKRKTAVARGFPGSVAPKGSLRLEIKFEKIGFFLAKPPKTPAPASQRETL